jgi:hypothetical protein
MEAGSDPESYEYQVPCFHALSTEEEEMAWNSTFTTTRLTSSAT